MIDPVVALFLAIFSLLRAETNIYYVSTITDKKLLHILDDRLNVEERNTVKIKIFDIYDEVSLTVILWLYTEFLASKRNCMFIKNTTLATSFIVDILQTTRDNSNVRLTICVM